MKPSIKQSIWVGPLTLFALTINLSHTPAQQPGAIQNTTSISSAGSAVTSPTIESRGAQLKSNAQDIRALSQRRRDLTEQFNAVQKRLDQDQSDLSARARADSAIQSLKPDLNDPNKGPQAQKDTSNWQIYADQFRPAESLKIQVVQDQQERDRILQSLETVENQLNEDLDIVKPEQAYKTELSIAFAVLIGGVIAGFYVIGWKDQTVRASIFTGDSGLQFITLFALIIAIILFGLTDVLEGRELAALLGGISGYILGRSSATARSNTQPPSSTHPPESSTPGTSS